VAVSRSEGGGLPTKQQLKWSQLRVGLTVVFASLMLAFLIFLMTGAQGLFVSRIKLRAYFDDTSGLRVGAPVRLQGVDIGNVSRIQVIPSRREAPVEITMRVSTRYGSSLRQDSKATLTTAGVLGEEFVDIDSIGATGPPARDGDTLPTEPQPQLSDVVQSSQTTLQNMQALLKRTDRILTFVESGQGSMGKLIYDDQLYRRLNATILEIQQLTNQLSTGQGSIGKLIMSDELYNKANGTVDRLNATLDEINSERGTVGRLLKDPALYNNANEAVSRANRLMGDISAGKGALGKFASDPEFARKLDDTVTKLSDLAEKINSGQGSLGKLVNDPSLYNNADQMLVETRKLVQAIREHPKQYLSIRMRIF
jgi:phospholipid/cholesterol/gamma-HCH transport system substrate-binding protein